jgi:hypothetical protein
MINVYLKELEEYGSTSNTDMGNMDDVDGIVQSLYDEDILYRKHYDYDTLYNLVWKAMDKAAKIANKKYNSNKQQNKMKITESQLRNIIKESIQTILKESAYDINSPEYKQMYDSGNKWYDGRDTKYDHTSKEIEDYEALPDKARHPYGAEIPDFSDRIKDRWAIHDTLARKGQNSILRKQQNKREFLEMVKSFSPFFLMWCSSNKGMSKEEVKTLPDKELISLYRQYLIHGHEGRRRPI